MDDEITVWMNQLSKSPEAAEKIWAHYYDKLVRYASKKLGATPRRDADEEDVAISAFESLFRGVEQGRFPQFDNRENLWRILLTITSHKAKKRIRHQLAQKRGGGDVRGESIFMIANGPGGGIANFAFQEPTPEFADMVSEECEELLSQLNDDVLRAIAIWKLQGYTNIEIAEMQDCAVRSVERKLKRIRSIWSAASQAGPV